MPMKASDVWNAQKAVILKQGSHHVHDRSLTRPFSESNTKPRRQQPAKRTCVCLTHSKLSQFRGLESKVFAASSIKVATSLG